MSILVMSQVWKSAPFKGTNLLVLLALADAADDEGLCWPSVQTLSAKARASESAVHRSLRALEEAGWLDREHRSGSSNLYRVTPDRGGCQIDTPVASGTGGGAASDTRGVPPVAPRTVIEPSLEPPLTSEAPELSLVVAESRPEVSFERWYADYPKKGGRGHAMRAWNAAVKKATPAEIYAGLQRQLPFMEKMIAEGRKKYLKLPSTWLNGECWDDPTEDDAGDDDGASLRWDAQPVYDYDSDPEYAQWRR